MCTINAHLGQAVDGLPQESQVCGQRCEAAPEADVTRREVHGDHVEVQCLPLVVAGFVQQPQRVVGVRQVGRQLDDLQQQPDRLLIPACTNPFAA